MTPDGFDLLYEGGPCLIVAKPGGLLTQAAPGVDNLESRIKHFLKVRDQKPGGVYLATLHRLDRPVSGLLVFAKHVRAASRLAAQFANRSVRKKYWAVLEGIVEPRAGTWIDYVRKIPDVARAEIVNDQHPDGRKAVLHYRVLDVRERRSLLEIELETGRNHQIRVQAASRGFPVLGDAQYGAPSEFGPQTPDPRDRWIALHSRSLLFQHPMTRDMVYQTAPLPAPWEPLGWSEAWVASRAAQGEA